MRDRNQRRYAEIHVIFHEREHGFAIGAVGASAAPASCPLHQ
jgi:hypothetical protein